MKEVDIGEKIRYYRKLRKMSQFELENEAGLASGSISRIENGITDPTKETIIAVSFVLKLKSNEVASLFGINIYEPSEIINSCNRLFSCSDIDELANEIVDNLIFKLGFIASAFFIVDRTTIYPKAITSNHVSAITFKLLNGISLEKIRYKLTPNNPSYLVKAILDKKPRVTERNWEYLYPALSKDLADEIQESTGDKNTLILPIHTSKNTLGALALASKVETDFQDNINLFEAVTAQIAHAMQKFYETQKIKISQEKSWT